MVHVSCGHRAATAGHQHTSSPDKMKKSLHVVCSGEQLVEGKIVGFLCVAVFFCLPTPYHLRHPSDSGLLISFTIFHRNIFFLHALGSARSVWLEPVRDTLHMVEVVHKKRSRQAQMASQKRLYRTDTNGRI